MMENIWFIAAFWMGLALLASLISIRLGISVALIEILLGVVVGNLHNASQAPLLHTTEWANFLAMLGSGVLTFLAGAEIDPNSLRANLRASLSIGALSFSCRSWVSGCSPYDGSKGGKAALRRGAVLAKSSNAQLTALWVREPLPRHSDLPGELEGEAEAADEYFRERRKEIEEVGSEQDIVIRCETRRGHPAKNIVTFAKEADCDLIVVGHSDHSELWGRLLGDTADRISDHAHCSVLIVKN